MTLNIEHNKDPEPGDLLHEPLLRTSLVSHVVERIRRSIVIGALKPGDTVVESQLAASLQVSRGTVREATARLVADGLLEKLPNCAPRVTELTLEKTWEIYTLRSLIEGFAAGILAQRLGPEHAEKLTAIWQHMYDAAQANDKVDYADWDFALHRTIVELSGHAELIRVWHSLDPWIRLTFSIQEYSAEGLRKNAQDHRRVVDAVISRNPKMADTVLQMDLAHNISLKQFDGFPENIW